MMEYIFKAIGFGFLAFTTAINFYYWIYNPNASVWMFMVTYIFLYGCQIANGRD